MLRIPMCSLVIVMLVGCEGMIIEGPREDSGTDADRDSTLDVVEDAFDNDVPILDARLIDAQLRDQTVGDSATSPDTIPDASIPDANIPDAIVPDAPCSVGTVIQSRAVNGGSGCTLGQKIQDLTCIAGGVYQWVDRTPFDGSRRACSPGQTDATGVACGAQSCVCTAACAWQAVAPTDCPSKRTVFVNFDGVVLGHCPNCDDPRTNRSYIVGDPYGGSASQWTFAGFGRGRSARDTILNNLSRYYSRFCVDFVDVRPTSGAYTMVIVSDTNLLPNHGVCARDCNDAGERVCIVNKISDDSIDTISRYTAHELGHSYGLTHVSNNADIMQTISSGSAFASSAVNDPACGLALGQIQNGPAILQSRMGLRSEDGVGATCHVNGSQGRCINTSTANCGGTLHSGVCPGPGSVRCCI